MKRTLSILAAGLLLCWGAAAAPALPNAKKMSRLVESNLDFAAKQAMLMYGSVKDLPEALPNQTDMKGKFVTCKSHSWVSGFHPGLLWYIYENTGDAKVMEAADVLTRRITKEQYNKDSHDVGFMLNCSFGNGYRLTGWEDYRQVLVNGANSLATRFNPAVGCTRSWKSRFGWDFVVIIDNMMNLELLAVSSGLTGDLTNIGIARTHANTTMRNHFRPDGSSVHVVDYDEATGRINQRVTRQGLSDDSAWARGQGWGLYGFTMMYRQTGDKAYLQQACKIADFIAGHKNLPKDKIPYWDFDAPAKKTTPRDASAGALIASALIELSQYTDGARSARYLGLAEQMLVSLSGKTYRASKPGDNSNFILKHATVFFKNDNYDTALTYADYYYVEALMRYKRLLQGRPVVDVRTAWSGNPDRQAWLSSLDHFARPVLENLSRGTLKKNMPVETTANNARKREECTHLEALGRVMVGIAPWLELGPDETPEGRLRAEYIDLACKAIAQGVDPDSPDYLNFNKGKQPLVDAAFLAHGLLRAPKQLWGNLDAVTKERLIAELKSSRVIKPLESNWLLFASTVEAALLEFTGEWDAERALYGVKRFRDDWYKGDGWYGDGPMLHIDYYNSYVIQPMLIQVLQTMKAHNIEGADFYDVAVPRYARFAAIQERFISPEGTFPVVGRSLCYRIGAFQALSDVAYRHILPAEVSPAQVRCGLTAVLRRQMEAPGTFDGNGWLTLGFAGHQPGIAETYISTGSLYLCSAGYIVLGLPEDDPFWTDPAAPWTSKKVWEGADHNVDHAIKN